MGNIPVKNKGPGFISVRFEKKKVEDDSRQVYFDPPVELPAGSQCTWGELQ